MSQSGNNQKKIKLIFERTTDASVLSNFLVVFNQWTALYILNCKTI